MSVFGVSLCLARDRNAVYSQPDHRGLQLPHHVVSRLVAHHKGFRPFALEELGGIHEVDLGHDFFGAGFWTGLVKRSFKIKVEV